MNKRGDNLGSICHVFKKEYWDIVNQGILKGTNKIAYNVMVGECDDYGGRCYLGVWMLKEVYDKVIIGEYDYISQAYSDPPIIIKNKNNEIISPLEDKIQ